MYACQIWEQNFNTLNKTQVPQYEAVHIINFKANTYDVGELYKNDKIFKYLNYIKLLNCLSVSDVLRNLPIPAFQNFY